MLLARPFGKKVKYRIGGMAAFFLIFLAIVVDILTLIPFLGMVIGWIFWLFFYMLIVFILGVSLKASDLVTGGISSFAELLPIVQMFPTITLGVVRIILSTRKQDRKKALSASKAEKKAVAQSSGAQNTEEQVA